MDQSALNAVILGRLIGHFGSSKSDNPIPDHVVSIECTVQNTEDMEATLIKIDSIVNWNVVDLDKVKVVTYGEYDKKVKVNWPSGGWIVSFNTRCRLDVLIPVDKELLTLKN